MISLGNIANATESEIHTFCLQENAHPHKISEEQQYLNRRCQAIEDAKILQSIKVTTTDILCKLTALFAKASQSQPVQTIELDGDAYRLEGYTRRAKLCDVCVFCAHETPAPRSFSIQNCATKKIVPIFESTLHDIQEHAYFGCKDTFYRIDPLILCEVLTLKR